MAPTKASDTSHLDNFTAAELEDILVQLCDSEGVKVSPDDDKPLKNMGKNALDNMGLGGLGKKVFGGGGKKADEPPASPDGPAPSMPPSDPKPAPPAPRPASDVIRELNLGDKQGLIGILQNVIAMAFSGQLDGKGGGNPLFACFGNLLKGGGDKSRTANSTNAAAPDGQMTQGSGPGGMTMEDIKTPEALFKFITTNPAVKTMLISGVQSFLAKAMQGGQAART